MKVCNETIFYLEELLRESLQVTVLIPTIVLCEEYDGFDRFKSVRDSLTCLKNDKGLIVTVKEVDDDLTGIKVKIRDDNHV